MQNYRELLNLFEAIKQEEINSTALGGRTKKTSRKIRVMLGRIKKLISLARKELTHADNANKPMYINKAVQGSLFPDDVLLGRGE